MEDSERILPIQGLTQWKILKGCPPIQGLTRGKFHDGRWDTRPARIREKDLEGPKKRGIANRALRQAEAS